MKNLTKEETVLVEMFEESTGLEYDPFGPMVDECEYCSGLIQFIPDHSCRGFRAESAEAKRNSDYNMDYYSGNE